MSEFVLISWFLCLTTSGLLFAAVLRYRFLLIKPSILVVIFFHLFIQWGATVYSTEIQSSLPDPWPFVFLAHGFPLIGFVVSFFIGRKSARVVWLRLRNPQHIDLRIQRRAIWILTFGVVVISAIYLHYVPLSATGLYVILTDPQNSTQAREESLALLANPFIQYLYSFLTNAFAPLLATLLSIWLIRCLKNRSLFRGLVPFVMLVGLLIAVSLTGARSFAATVVLVILFAWFLRRGLSINLIYLALGVIAVLTFPTLLSLLREGQDLTFSNFWEYLSIYIFRRVFYTPMQMGVWHVNYAQTVGLIGVAGIPRLASLFGVTPINVPNMIARLYYEYAIDSSYANVSYVFSYYADFGLISLPFSLIGLWLLDGALWGYRHLSDGMLLPCVASISVICTYFISVDYTVVLLTDGFGVVLFLAWLLDWIGRSRIKTEMAPVRRAEFMQGQGTTGRTEG